MKPVFRKVHPFDQRDFAVTIAFVHIQIAIWIVQKTHHHFMLTEDSVYVFANPRQKIATANMLRFDTQRHKFIEKNRPFRRQTSSFYSDTGRELHQKSVAGRLFPAGDAGSFRLLCRRAPLHFPPFSSANL